MVTGINKYVYYIQLCNPTPLFLLTYFNDFVLMETVFKLPLPYGFDQMVYLDVKRSVSVLIFSKNLEHTVYFLRTLYRSSYHEGVVWD